MLPNNLIIGVIYHFLPQKYYYGKKLDLDSSMIHDHSSLS